MVRIQPVQRETFTMRRRITLSRRQWQSFSMILFLVLLSGNRQSITGAGPNGIVLPWRTTGLDSTVVPLAGGGSMIQPPREKSARDQEWERRESEERMRAWRDEK